MKRPQTPKSHTEQVKEALRVIEKHRQLQNAKTSNLPVKPAPKCEPDDGH